MKIFKKSIYACLSIYISFAPFLTSAETCSTCVKNTSNSIVEYKYKLRRIYDKPTPPTWNEWNNKSLKLMAHSNVEEIYTYFTYNSEVLQDRIKDNSIERNKIYDFSYFISLDQQLGKASPVNLLSTRVWLSGKYNTTCSFATSVSTTPLTSETTMVKYTNNTSIYSIQASIKKTVTIFKYRIDFLTSIVLYPLLSTIHIMLNDEDKLVPSYESIRLGLAYGNGDDLTVYTTPNHIIINTFGQGTRWW